MFRKVHLFLIVGAIVGLAGVYGSAALTSLTIDRTTTFSVAVDNEASAGVIMTCLGSYSSLCDFSGGKLQLDLNKGLKSDGSAAYNRGGTFVLGDDANNVLSITNNTSYTITVQLPVPGGDSGTPVTMYMENGVTDANATTSAQTIGVGATKEFRFTISPPTSGTVSAPTLQIRKQ